MPRKDLAFCKQYLDKVSRTFSLNINVLRGTPYRGILLAYLLCRIADTIEDDGYFPAQHKAQKLRDYSRLFPPSKDFPKKIETFLSDMSFTHQNDCIALLLNTHRVFNELVKLPANMIAVISHHVREMAQGMAEFQERGKKRSLAFLEDQNDLERYCYFVAGTVGLMITTVFSESSRKVTGIIQKRLEKRSVQFGLGLQITNIAKDFFGDRQRGWCYVPRSFFLEAGIDPLIDTYSDKADAYLRVHKRLVHIALAYLDEALLYTLDIPRTLVRYRLFCLWPLFMAVETLARVYGEGSLFEGEVVKIGRNDVRRIVRNTSLLVMSNSALEKMYRTVEKRIGR